MTWEVLFSPEAAEDLERLFDHLLERELSSPTGNLDLPAQAIAAIQRACEWLAHSPFSCRKAAGHPTGSPLVRELIISWSRTGYVALFEICEGRRVVIGAVRHQRENDYH